MNKNIEEKIDKKYEEKIENGQNKALLEKILKTNLLPLAFIGDSLHTMFVREFVLQNNPLKMENYHSIASKYCKAPTQAKVLKEFMPYLTDEENEIVRRGRNAKPKHHAKNSSIADYSYATAFEVLIGYLYLKGDKDRLNEILDFSVKTIL